MVLTDCHGKAALSEVMKLMRRKGQLCFINERESHTDSHDVCLSPCLSAQWSRALEEEPRIQSHLSFLSSFSTLGHVLHSCKLRARARACARATTQFFYIQILHRHHHPSLSLQIVREVFLTWLLTLFHWRENPWSLAAAIVYTMPLR